MSQKIKNLSVFLKKIPPNSAIKTYKVDTQKEIVKELLNGDSPFLVAKRWKEKGLEGITTQQLIRVKRHLMPMWLIANTPNTLFQDEKIHEQLTKLEFLLNEQYSRIVEAINTEDEEKNVLKPNKFAKINIFSDQPGGFEAKLREYYEGNINELDKKILFSTMDRQGQNFTINKMLKEFMDLYTKYLVLRQSLGDSRIKLDIVEEKKEKFDLEIIEGLNVGDIRKNFADTPLKQGVKDKKKA